MYHPSNDSERIQLWLQPNEDLPATMESLLAVTTEAFSLEVRTSTSAAHPRLEPQINRYGKAETTPFCQQKSTINDSNRNKNDNNSNSNDYG